VAAVQSSTAGAATRPATPLEGTPVVGVVGAGQLARMLAEPAGRLGIALALLAETADGSAAQVIPAATVGDYRDLATLRDFAEGLDVLTFDHEHVPTEHLGALVAAGVACRPGPEALVFAQDKLAMRGRLAPAVAAGGLGVPCPEFARVRTAAEVSDFAERVGWPVVLKVARGGYDGRGVWVAEGPSAPGVTEAFGTAARNGVEVMAERHVAFVRELAALAVRSPSGQAVAYPVVQSTQRDGICHEVIAPAPGLSDEQVLAAQGLALTIARGLEVTGVLAVELFETADGSLLVNELAMRPHNTGHWSIDGAVTSQFENHLRAVLDLPLGTPNAREPWTVMVNLLGADLPDLHPALRHVLARDPRIKVHIYGKEARPGRKLGHVTAWGDDLEQVLERARHAAGYLVGEIDE
jgi:5-(carboxyamino)imidazole ribonucleotide synthase